ncbi:hypothetical protein Gasu2_13470 [Galdieria sulphuraria]|nr:hypothetical protein Gasu2_13470 [Galdieria sulphuraria]
MKYFFVIILLYFLQFVAALQIASLPPLPSQVVINPRTGLYVDLHRKILRLSDSTYENVNDELEAVYVSNEGLKGNWATCFNGTDPTKCPTAGSLEATETNSFGSPLIRNEQGDHWNFESEVDQQGNGYFYVDYNCSSSGSMQVSMFFLIETLTESSWPFSFNDQNNFSAVLEFINSVRLMIPDLELNIGTKGSLVSKTYICMFLVSTDHSYSVQR